MTLQEKIQQLQSAHGFKLIQPLANDTVTAEIESLGLNQAFLQFYQITNGIEYEWFRLLPIEDSSNIKNTWDGLKKANDSAKTKFGLDSEFLDRFVVFAEIGPGECAVFDRTDESIWFEQDEELQRTDYDLEAFIETCLREVDEL